MNPTRATLSILSAAAFLAPTAGALQAPDWTRESPIPSNTSAYAQLTFLDAQRGYLVGNGGKALETVDGGLTWQPASMPADAYDVICAIDSQHAWAVGSSHTARTVDGGQSWQALPFLGISNEIEFLDANFGWVASNYAAAITHDGGLTWDVAVIDSNTRVSYPDFVSPLLGLGVEDDYSAIWQTTDGGASWNEVLTADVDSVAFLDSSVAIAVGNGQVHRSTDAGQTWQPIAGSVNGARIVVLDPQRAFVFHGLAYSWTSDGGQSWSSGSWGTGANVTKIVHRGGSVLVALDTDGNVLASTDAGASWSIRRRGEYVALTDVSFLPGGRAVAAGPNYVLASEDGGSSWNEVSSGTGANVYDIAMWDLDAGLFCGQHATTCVTEDGGESWKNGRPAWEFFGMNDAEAVDVVEPDFGIVVGEAGAPIVTHDRGRTWEQLGSFTASHALGAVDFVTEDIGWVGSVGPTAWLLRTLDGGQSWEVQYGPGFGSIRAIHMFDTQRGIAIADGSFVISTDDGGDTWTPSALPISQGAIDLDFAGDQHGWVVGDFGTILRTTNGGATWLDQSQPISEHLSAIDVVAPDEAWAVGSGDTVLHTIDAGATWEQVDTPTTDPFHPWEAVHVAADRSVRIGGWYGAVLHLPGPDTFGWETYCTTSTTTVGCTPEISADGVPGVDFGGPFVVRCDDVPSNTFGTFFYGVDGPASAPFQGGTLCVATPVVRTPVQFSDGDPSTIDCSGSFAFDVDAWIGSGADPDLLPGTTVHGQFWFRDPGNGFGSALSDGIEFVILP